MADESTAVRGEAPCVSDSTRIADSGSDSRAGRPLRLTPAFGRDSESDPDEQWRQRRKGPGPFRHCRSSDGSEDWAGGSLLGPQVGFYGLNITRPKLSLNATVSDE